jgi:hypothetical protein
MAATTTDCLVKGTSSMVEHHSPKKQTIILACTTLDLHEGWCP